VFLRRGKAAIHSPMKGASEGLAQRSRRRRQRGARWGGSSNGLAYRDILRKPAGPEPSRSSRLKEARTKEPQTMCSDCGFRPGVSRSRSRGHLKCSGRRRRVSMVCRTQSHPGEEGNVRAQENARSDGPQGCPWAQRSKRLQYVATRSVHRTALRSARAANPAMPREAAAAIRAGTR
jgi:hypothetical protein